MNSLNKEKPTIQTSRNGTSRQSDSKTDQSNRDDLNSTRRSAGTSGNNDTLEALKNTTVEEPINKNVMLISKLDQISYFGEVDILLKTKRRFNCMAQTDIDVLVMSRTDFESIIPEEYPHIYDNLRDIAYKRYAEEGSRIDSGKHAFNHIKKKLENRVDLRTLATRSAFELDDQRDNPNLDESMEAEKFQNKYLKKSLQDLYQDSIDHQPLEELITRLGGSEDCSQDGKKRKKNKNLNTVLSNLLRKFNLKEDPADTILNSSLLPESYFFDPLENQECKTMYEEFKNCKKQLQKKLNTETKIKEQFKEMTNSCMSFVEKSDKKKEEKEREKERVSGGSPTPRSPLTPEWKTLQLRLQEMGRMASQGGEGLRDIMKKVEGLEKVVDSITGGG